MVYVSDFSIHNQFSERSRVPPEKMSRISCNWCDEYKNHFKNTTRMKNHLVECTPFIIHAGNVNHPLVVEINAAKLKRKHEDKEANSNPAPKRQNTLPFAKMSAAEKDNLDILATRVITAGGRPLNLFENPNMAAFLNALNSAYKPPSRTTISITLLDRVYEEEHRQVHSITNSSDNLNFTIDEFSNVNQDRMYALTAQISGYSSFHLDSEDMSFFSHTAENFAPRIAEKMMY